MTNSFLLVVKNVCRWSCWCNMFLEVTYSNQHPGYWRMPPTHIPLLSVTCKMSASIIMRVTSSTRLPWSKFVKMFCLLFKLKHPGVLRCVNNKTQWTKQTLVPFTVFVHWLSVCPYFSHLSTYAHTWRLDTSTASFNGCWISSHMFWFYIEWFLRRLIVWLEL